MTREEVQAVLEIAMFQRDMNSEAEYAAHMISWLPHGAAHLAAKGGKTSWLATTSVCRLLSRARVFASTLNLFNAPYAFS